MIKKSLLAVVALSLFACSSAYGQFRTINPSDLTAATGPINDIFDISGLLNAPANTVSLQVANGFATASDSWTVDENETTTFILSGTTLVEAFVNHGANLGSEAFANGSLSRDGITAAPGETWTLSSELDSDYTAGQNANDYFVDYTGAETNSVQSNSNGFLWISDQAVSTFSVFSSNTTDLDNNYGIGFRQINAVPEPAAGIVISLVGLLALRRRKRS